MGMAAMDTARERQKLYLKPAIIMDTMAAMAAKEDMEDTEDMEATDMAREKLKLSPVITMVTGSIVDMEAMAATVAMAALDTMDRSSFQKFSEGNKQLNT